MWWLLSHSWRCTTSCTKTSFSRNVHQLLWTSGTNLDTRLKPWIMHSPISYDPPIINHLHIQRHCKLPAMLLLLLLSGSGLWYFQLTRLQNFKIESFSGIYEYKMLSLLNITSIIDRLHSTKKESGACNNLILT